MGYSSKSTSVGSFIRRQFINPCPTKSGLCAHAEFYGKASSKAGHSSRCQHRRVGTDSWQYVVSAPGRPTWRDWPQDSDDNSTEPADDQVWTAQPLPAPPINPAMQRLVQGEISGAYFLVAMAYLHSH